MNIVVGDADGSVLARFTLSPYEAEDAAKKFAGFTYEHRQLVMKALNGDGSLSVDGRALGDVPLVVMRERLKRAIAGEEWRTSWDDDPEPQIPHRWVMPGIFPWGSVPQLTGQPKAGKSLLVQDMLAALTVPGRLFLGRFQASEAWLRTVSADHDEPGVITLVVSEKPGHIVKDALRAAGVDMMAVRVHYLKDLKGGPGSFDLTNPAKFDYWLTQLHYCEDCDGTDDLRPSMVVVDNVLPILAAVGNGPESYHFWEAKFRQLLLALDCDNGLFVTHSFSTVARPLGGPEAWALSDGLWSYMADDPLKNHSPRRLTITANQGAEGLRATRVVLSEDGLLRLVDAPAAAEPVPPSQPRKRPPATAASADEDGDPASAAVPEAPPRKAGIGHEVLAYVARCNARGHGPTLRDVREHVAGRNPEIDAAVTALRAAGRLEDRRRKGRGGGSSFWAVGPAQEPSEGAEGDASDSG